MGASPRFPDWAAQPAHVRAARCRAAADDARRLEPRLRAFVAIETPAWRGGGPLADTPYAAKDMFATAARRPLAGLASAADFGLVDEGEVIRRLDGAGARRIGFTAMTELAYEPSGHNSVSGRARNPWNLDFVTGGSSSGSAAAVASGVVAIALGSDTGGSLRIPAHCCGVTAWKPTFGAVPTQGAVPLAPSLDTIGLLARSAADMTAAVAVLAPELQPASEPMTRGVVLSDLLDMAEAAVRRACADGIAALAACGVRLETKAAAPAIEVIDGHALTVMQAEAARIHRARLDDPALDPTLRKRLAKGLAIGEAALAQSRAARTPLADRFIADLMERADVALLPVMTIRTPPAADTDPASPTFSARRLYELSRLTRFVNLLGFPALAVPVGFDDRGLPVALQLVGRPGSDRALLALAAAMQARSDWHARVPTAVADLVAPGVG